MVPASVLRPLGIGEMLDRAVTLSVRSFVLLMTIYVVFALPLAVFQYFGTADLSKFFGGLVDVLASSSQRADQAAVLKALTVPQVFNAFTVLYFAMVFVVSPLPGAALIWTASEIYAFGRVPTFREAYRAGLRAWPPLIALNFLWIASALLAYVVVVIAVVLIALGVVLLNLVLKGVGIAIGVVVGFVLLVAVLVVAIMAYLAANVSYFSVVVERAGFITAFAAGLSRIFARSPRRSALAGLALAAVLFGVSVMGSIGQGLLFGLLRSNAFGTAFSALLNLVAVIFMTVFVAIYYYDIRVRSEGLDLELAAASSLTARDATAL